MHISPISHAGSQLVLAMWVQQNNLYVVNTGLGTQYYLLGKSEGFA